MKLSENVVLGFITYDSGSLTPSPSVQDNQIFRRTNINSWFRQDAQKNHYVLDIEMEGCPNSLEGCLTFSSAKILNEAEDMAGSFKQRSQRPNNDYGNRNQQNSASNSNLPQRLANVSSLQ